MEPVPRSISFRRRDRKLDLKVPLSPVLLDVLRDGPVPLRTAEGHEAPALDIAIVIPQFRRGSGGHHTIADLVRGLETRGHRIELWLEDEEGRHDGESAEQTKALFDEFFGEVTAGLRRDFDRFAGTDVALATGWQTVARVLRLPAVSARAYLVQDHEPEFYGTSAERLWAEWSFRQGLHCICASPWLADLVRETYGASASSFDLGVDHEHYRALPTHRRQDLVLAYARAVTPRRAVPLVLLAMQELHRRRPEIEIALFGEARPIDAPFPYRQLGVLDPPALAHAYASAAVGVVASLTNPSLVPTEMLACGLPVVDVASPAMVATFGADGPIELAELDPLRIAAAVERLLDDLVLRAERSREGTALAVTRTWDGAAQQVEAGLRTALRRALPSPP
jgi:glycosyltransferase involved in cell wall biosynthesis